MADVWDSVKQAVPSINFSGIVGTITWIILIIVAMIIIGIVVFIIIQRKNYKHTIVIFEKINGRYQDTSKDKAMEVKLNKGGDTVFYLQKRKKYLPTPRLQSGRRKYYYMIREDGEWINFELGDFDQQMKKLGAHFLDKEMRYARTSLQAGLKERYEEKGFWKEHGVLIVSIAFITIIGVMTWLLFDKWIGLANATTEGVKASQEVMKLAQQILGSIDNIKSGGSGVVPVNP